MGLESLEVLSVARCVEIRWRVYWDSPLKYIQAKYKLLIRSIVLFKLTDTVAARSKSQ